MLVSRIKGRISRSLYPIAESIFRSVERAEFSRASTLQQIPKRLYRGGGLGTTSYGEWCFSLGFFQALIGANLTERPLNVLDVGCGVGRLYLATKPFLQKDDTYHGIDVSPEFVAISQRLFGAPSVRFLHTRAGNAYYSKSAEGQSRWPFPDGSMNFVTGLSVWTHLNESDWRHYLGEVARVLRPGGRAILSFFVMDEHYFPDRKTGRMSEFYPQPENKWIFDQPAYGSKNWLCPSWVAVPEVAIAVTRQVFDDEVAAAGLQQVQFHSGQWKDRPGMFFQDIAVLQKAN